MFALFGGGRRAAHTVLSALFWIFGPACANGLGVSARSLVLCSALLLGSCGQPARRPAPDAGAEVDGSQADSAQQAEGAPTQEARRTRAPWLEDPDEVAQRYPAFGVTLHHMAYVYQAPKKGAKPIGYLRRGARFRASEEVSRTDCARGWFEAYGGGFVCNGEGVRIDSQPPAYEDSPVLPDLSAPLPYAYRKVVTHDLLQFLRLPSAAEEQAVAQALAQPPADESGTAPAPVDAIPSRLANLVRMRMQPGFYVSVDKEVEDTASPRRFVRTVRGGYVRAERLAEAKQPKGIGVPLGDRYTLPLALVYRTGAPRLRRDPLTGELVKAGPDLPLHSAHALTGESIVKAGRRYFMTKEGLFVRDTAVRIVDRVPRPKLVGRKERWIRVDLDRQTLTAYEGETPVFATLVSSGVAEHATPVGLYRVHAKHVATTMDDLASDGDAYSIEDVPWTQYFLGSYALHAAFWHERFGHPRSHGCVNLAPRDARWLFFWSLPELPSGWHGVLAEVGKGTSVLVDKGVTFAVEQGEFGPS